MTVKIHEDTSNDEIARPRAGEATMMTMLVVHLANKSCVLERVAGCRSYADRENLDGQ